MPTSPRLTYRRLAHADTNQFRALCSDEHVKEYLLDGEVVSPEWAIEAVELSDRLFETEGAGLWLVLCDDEPIGFCGFRVFPELGAEPQLLYAVSGGCIGKGYATEAAMAMLVETRRLGWVRVVAAVDEPNTASVRVLQKLGFVGCGRVPGGFGNTLLFERFEEMPPTRLAAPSGSRWELTIQHTWDGVGVGDREAVTTLLALEDDQLSVCVDAPFHDDPAPDSEDLWNHEVVEVMLVGGDDRYLEVELSPHGQHLVLFLHGARRVAHRGVVLGYRAQVDGDRWTGEAHIPIGWVPPGTTRLNAFAIHGTGDARRYLAWKPTGGSIPDFHRLAGFGSFDDC